MKPSPGEIRAAHGRTVPDVIAPGLRVLFCGINPGLYSGAVGRHFARPGNRFWKALHLGGLTPRLLAPEEERELPALGYGITNLVARATGTAKELSPEELVAGKAALAEKVGRFGPAWLAPLGVEAYRTAFGWPEAVIGLQPQTVAGARIWVLPNPSGLNAHYSLERLAELFAELRRVVWEEAP
jgi:TDG/mug DNA glycosylase family protein